MQHCPGRCLLAPLPEHASAAAAAAVDGGGAEGGLGISDLCVWCKSRMSAHKVPRHLIVVRELPRNAMGKVTKPALRGLFS